MPELHHFSTYTDNVLTHKKIIKSGNSSLVLQKRKPEIVHQDLMLGMTDFFQKKNIYKVPIKKIANNSSQKLLQIENLGNNRKKHEEAQILKQQIISYKNLESCYLKRKIICKKENKTQPCLSYGIKHLRINHLEHQGYPNQLNQLQKDKKNQMHLKIKFMNLLNKQLSHANKKNQKQLFDVQKENLQMKKCQQKQINELHKIKSESEDKKQQQNYYYEQLNEINQVKQQLLQKRQSQILYISVNRMQIGPKQRIGFTKTNQGIQVMNFFNQDFHRFKPNQKFSRIYNQDLFNFTIIKLYPGYTDILKRFASKCNIYKVMFGFDSLYQTNKDEYNTNIQFLSKFIEERIAQKKKKQVFSQKRKETIISVKLYFFGYLSFYLSKRDYLISSLMKYKQNELKTKKVLQICQVHYQQVEKDKKLQVFTQSIKVGYKILQQAKQILNITLTHFSTQHLNQFQSIQCLFNNHIKVEPNILIWAQLPAVYHKIYIKNYKDLYQKLSHMQNERRKKPLYLYNKK